MISNEQVQYFFTHSEDSICIISSTGKLLYSNPAAEKLFGISAKESVKIWEAVPYIEGNDALIQLFIDSILSKVDTHEAIVDYWNNEGKVRNIHVKMTHFMQDQSVYLVVITDLTQLFKVNSALIRYTSPDIADYALMTAEGQKRGGQTKNVTILMSDLRGFTALGAKLSAEELITVLNHYFEAMVAVIQKYKGTVIEFLGDGIFTVFGAPKDIPEHATLAVKCAVEMQAALKAVNEWNEKNGFPPLEMGVGINTGNAVVGNIGSDKKMKYGCMGSTVNITGRLESLTVGGQVFITDNTRQQIVEDLLTVSEGSFLPKGSPNELKYCEIKGIGDLVLTNDMDDIVWLDNPDDNEYQFYLLEEKTVGVNTLKGRLIKLSDNKRFALMATDAELSEKMNIMLRHEEKRIYAKVIRKEPDGYVICFTSIQQND